MSHLRAAHPDRPTTAACTVARHAESRTFSNAASHRDCGVSLRREFTPMASDQRHLPVAQVMANGERVRSTAGPDECGRVKKMTISVFPPQQDAGPNALICK